MTTEEVWKAIRQLQTQANRYIVANWAVEPNNRAWPENRIAISYRVTFP